MSSFLIHVFWHLYITYKFYIHTYIYIYTYICMYVYMYRSWKQCVLKKFITTMALWQSMHLDMTYDYYVVNGASCAKVHELPQNHCGDNQGGFRFQDFVHYTHLARSEYFEYHGSCLTSSKQRLNQKFGLNL